LDQGCFYLLLVEGLAAVSVELGEGLPHSLADEVGETVVGEFEFEVEAFDCGAHFYFKNKYSHSIMTYTAVSLI
jgi:hypothetical protein